MAALSLRGIVKRYGTNGAVIDGIDLDIGDGEFVVFVGPSGCGKSTLLRMIAGLEEISGGELTIGGRRANELPAARRGLAMVFQSYALYPHMTVFENMAFALQLAGQSRREVKEAVQRAADILQIGPLLQRRPKELSGGQRQRVAIGRAIVRKPELFLFDEPLSNLDASLRVQMRVEISRLHRELKTTMVYVTHDQVEAMTLGERIVVFNGGRIEQVGTPAQLYNRPGNLFVAGFLGAPKMNFIPAELLAADAHAGSASVRLPGGAVLAVPAAAAHLPAGAALTLGVRAEHLRLRAGGENGGESGGESGGENGGENGGDDEGALLDVGIGHVEYLGDQLVVYATLAGAPAMIAARHDAEKIPPQPGSAARLHVPSRRCLLFDAGGKALARPD